MGIAMGELHTKRINEVQPVYVEDVSSSPAAFGL